MTTDFVGSASAVALQQGVDESDGEVMVQLATEDESEVDRSHQELGCNRNIRVNSKVAPGDAPLEDAADFDPAGLDHRSPEGLSQSRVDRNLREQRPHDRTKGGL